MAHFSALSRHTEHLRKVPFEEEPSPSSLDYSDIGLDLLSWVSNCAKDLEEVGKE